MIKRLLIAVAMLCAVSEAQVSVAPIVQPRVTFVDAAGNPCNGCSLYSYAAGTTTPQATYTDATGISQNTNPIVLDPAGGAFIWLGTNSYKLILKDQSGNLIWSVDHVNSAQFLPCSSANAVQSANSAVNGLTCDPTITINTINHTINIGTLPSNHVTIGALGTPTSWTLDTTSPTTAFASLGGGYVNASLFPGSPDIGTQVTNAIAALPILGGVHCGRVLIPAGTYTQTTMITKPRCVSIIGASAEATILNWTPTTGIAIQIADAGSGNGYPEGEIADLTLSGPGMSVAGPIAIYVGDTYPALVRYGDHQNLNRIRVLNWDTGITWGSNAWSTTIDQSLITSNNIGLSYPSTLVNANSGESISVIATRLQNSNQAMNLPGFGDFYFYADSCDFNLTCGTVNIAHFFGMHFEGNGGRMLTIKGVSESIVEIYGGFVAYDSGTGTDPDVFYIDPAADPNSLFKLSGITTILSHPVTNFVSWNVSGPNAQLTIEDLPNFNNATNITNATCTFVRCRIPGTWNGQNYLTTTGANIGNKLGFGMVYGNTAGLRLDATGTSATPCFLSTLTPSFNCIGNQFLATALIAGVASNTPITNTSNVPVTTATAPTGTCAPNGYISVVVNSVTLKLATCP